MRVLKVVCVLAIVFAISAIAYAETQSVKISGDITLRAFARDDFDLDSSDADYSNYGQQSNDWATFLQSTAEVQIDADLTDNVSGVIRLVNQRVWGDQPYGSTNYWNDENPTELGMVGVPFREAVSDHYVDVSSEAFKVDVDLAYIELKEFLYSPLTLRIGRQDLWFGRGFIIGANLRDPQNTLFAKEYTATKSFDAIRATLDYDPWTIDAVYAKMSEDFMRSDDDTNLFGINVGYVFDDYNAEAEGYWWYRQDRHVGDDFFRTQIGSDGQTSNDIHTIGLRGSFDPIEDWTVAVEGAYQFGDAMILQKQDQDIDRSAWAFDAAVECRYWQDDFAWKPVGGLEYIFYSGENEMGDKMDGSGATPNPDGTWSGWDPMYRGKFDTAIREFQNVFYQTAQKSCPSYTNQHQVILSSSIQPTDSLTISSRSAWFWLAEDFTESNGDKYVGQEIDISATWDYTEDVSFNLLTAWFFPGDHFNSDQDDVATDIVGTVKLSF